MLRSRPIQVRRRIAALLAVAVLVSGLGVVPAAGADSAGPGYAKPALNPSLQHVLRGGLGRVVADARQGRTRLPSGVPSRSRAGVSELAVTVAVDPGSASAVTASLRARKAAVVRSSSASIEAFLATTALEAVAQTPGVRSITPIYRRLPGGYVTPATGLYDAPAWQTAGFDGTGIKVGIVDVGFTGLSDLLGEEIADSVVARCYSDFGFVTSAVEDCEAGGDHGTAVAELVVDMAPGARLYIANPISPLDARDAIRWMTANGVRVINQSAASGFIFDGPGDGTAGRPDSTYEEVDLATSLDALWVNSAGNEGDTGWTGAWVDENGNDLVEFGPGDERNSFRLEEGQGIRVAMRWPDTWGASGNDYDVLLLDGEQIVAEGTDFQAGTGDPYELFDFVAPKAGTYDLMIGRFEADPTDRLQMLIFTDGPLTLEYAVTDGTLPSPADSANPGMVAVGAVKLEDPNVIEPYSSRGPTVDGRVKPDFVTTDCVATITYDVFCGTSASAPIAAGAAALALQATPHLNPTELAAYLRAHAVGLGEATPNNVFGHGRLKLGAPTTTKPGTSTVSIVASLKALTWPARLTLSATLAPALEGRRVQFHASLDGVTWQTVRSALTTAAGTAEASYAPSGSLRYRAVALGTAVTSTTVTVAMHQRFALRASFAPAVPGATVRTIKAGSVITFEGTVRPAREDLPAALVDFAVYQRVGAAWLRHRTFTVVADSAGRAVAPWHFDIPGAWYVQARAAGQKGAAASTWSERLRYDVLPADGGRVVRSSEARVASGAAALSIFSTGTGQVALDLGGLARSTTYTAAIRSGTCAAPALTLVSLGSVRTTAAGTARDLIPVSAGQVRALDEAASSEGDAPVLVLRAGSAVRCGVFVAQPVVAASIATGEEGSAITAHPSGVWVTNIFGDSISRIDPSANVLTTTIPVPGYPNGIAIDDSGDIWVSHLLSGTVSKVDPVTREVVDQARVGAAPGRMVVAAGSIWVAVRGDGEVVRIDPKEGAVTARIGVGEGPLGIAYADGSIWVTNADDGTVSRIDAETEEIIAVIDVPNVNDIAAVDGAVWVSIVAPRAASGSIARIDLETNEVTTRVVVGFDPAGLVIVGDTVYVAMSGEPTLVQVSGGVVTQRLAVGMKSLAVAYGDRSLWLLHPYAAGISGSRLFAGGVTRLNI